MWWKCNWEKYPDYLSIWGEEVFKRNFVTAPHPHFAHVQDYLWEMYQRTKHERIKYLLENKRRK
jgi:hypothetical protein